MTVKNKKEAEEVTAVSELEKLIYFDGLFRRQLNVLGNTWDVVSEKAQLDNLRLGKDYPTGRTAIFFIKDKLYSLGANFKEEKGGKTGRETLFEYEDPNQTLFGLEKLVGKLQRDKTLELLNLLEKRKATTPHEVWAKMFLKKMLNEGTAGIDYVSFNENLNLTGINEYFEVLLQFIIDKQPIAFGYKPFGSELRTVKVHPYYMKMYNSRWFLIGRVLNDMPREGHSEAYYETLGNFAIDRIKPMTANEDAIKHWNGVEFIENDVDFRQFFSEMVGVTDTGKAQDVILRFNQHRYNYVKTKPLSTNQCELKPEDEHYSEDKPTIKIHVKLNKELVQRILSFGKDVEVIAPETLRNRVIDEINAMQNLYK